MHTIYVDVLLILNIYVNYFLLRATAKLIHIPIRNKRCIIASVYGSIYSLIILIPQLNTAINLIIKLIAAVTIVLIAFGFHKLQRLLLNSLAFLSVNILFAGSIYGIYIGLKPEFIHFNNTYFYIDFSLLLLIISTAVIYFAVCGIRCIIDRTSPDSGCYKVIIQYKGENISIDGLSDTGNSLIDYFSGNPVIICGKNKIYKAETFECINDDDRIPKGFRLIPYSTINKTGMIPIFRPDNVIISDTTSGFKKNVDAMIGIVPENQFAIFNPRLLKL